MQKLKSQAEIVIKENGSSWAIDTALFLMGFLGLSYAAIFTVLLVRFPLQIWSLSLFFCLYAAVLGYWILQKYPRMLKYQWLPALYAFVIIVFSFIANALVYDTSYDGQGYHQMAIVSLTEGWNPIYTPPYGLSLWVWHYPKALWLIGANFYRITDLIETGKSMNMISFFVSFFATFAVLYRLFINRLSSGFLTVPRPVKLLFTMAAIVVALCAVCNPITIVQLFTYYNDGVIGSLLLTLISMLIYYRITSDKRSLLTVAICLIILVNIKFTAVAYAGLICTFFIIYIAYKNRNAFKRVFLFLACVGIISIVLFGYNPYIVNTISKGNPFYPLAGKGKVDIITNNSPANFINQNKFKNFLRSNTSTTFDPIKPEASVPTVLWPVKWSDYKNMEVDTRTAGFGPLTYWILIGSLSLWIILLLINWRVGIVASLITAGLMFTVFINPAPWWARYVPQLWLVPLALVTFGLITKSTIVRTVSVLVLIISLINAEETIRVVLGQKFERSSEVQVQYERLRNKHIQVFTNATASVLPHLQDHRIDYTEVKQEDLSCKNPTAFLYALGAVYCE